MHPQFWNPIKDPAKHPTIVANQVLFTNKAANLAMHSELDFTSSLKSYIDSMVNSVITFPKWGI